MQYELLNLAEARQLFTHYIFRDEEGEYYLADHSIRNLHDPASTDDGLLKVDFSEPAKVDNRKGNVHITVTQNGLRKCNLVTSLYVAYELGMIDYTPLLQGEQA